MTPGHSPRWSRLFDRVFDPWRRRRLMPTCFDDRPLRMAPDEPLILVANHVSWWDGFLLREVHARLRPQAPLFVVMLDAELAGRPWLARLGAIGVQPGSPRSVRRLFRALATRCERDPATVIGWFPQGRIWPVTRRPLAFEPGIVRLAERLAPATLLPVAIHLEPLNHAAPTPFIAMGEPLRAAPGRPSLDRLERAVERTLDTIRAHVDRYGERAPATWPPQRAEARAARAVDTPAEVASWNR